MNRISTMEIIKDSRVNCYSAMTTIKIKDYLELVGEAYKDRGGIKGQREPLKTKTAQRIRQRMIEDLKSGAVLPPVVVGVIISADEIQTLKDISKDNFDELLTETSPSNVSIIDGIQRTTALLELVDNLDSLMRVEFWVAVQTNSLIYRMLVLNTGQVPWNLRRQVEVVYDSLILEFQAKVPNLMPTNVDDKNRRKSAGKFSASQIVEWYLVFGTRKDKVNMEERLADDFTRLDFIEVTSNEEFTDIFSEVLKILVEFDFALEKYKPKGDIDRRFQIGLDLFGSQPAPIGFVVAMGIEILGRPGSKERPSDEQKARLEIIKSGANQLLEKLNGMEPEKIGEFLDFDTLNEVVARKSGKVGEFEREFFTKAFNTLIEQRFDVENLTSSWRAY